MISEVEVHAQNIDSLENRSTDKLNYRSPLCVIGISFQLVPAEVRGLLSLTGDRARKVLELSVSRGLTECVVLSTCNRTEIYFSGGDPELAAGLFAECAEVPTETLRPHLFVKHCSRAAAHLFRVVSGLESAVLGETEIVAQVKDAWRQSQAMGKSGALINLLFRRSLEAGKRVRTETDVCRNSVSTATLAVCAVQVAYGSLAGTPIALVGAGSISQRLAKELKATGARRVTVVNRTLSRAAAIAEEIGAKAIQLDQLAEVILKSDVVIAAAEVSRPLLDQAELQRIQELRNFRPLLLVDMGMPPNFGIDSVCGVTRIDIDQVSSQSVANADQRALAIPAAEAVLAEELVRFNVALAAQAAAPTIRALVQRSDKIRFKHVEWAKEQLPNLRPEEIIVLEEMAQKMMRAMLRAPIESLKTELHVPESQQLAVRLLGLGGPL